MRTLDEFYEKYPLSKYTLHTGKEFVYRYYRNAETSQTIVLLTGGIGLSDLFYLHFEEFAKDFSVMTFDYQLAFQNNDEFADAVAELLSMLHIKAWLAGQSLGGIVAQIIAKKHPEVVAGMALSNTCSLSANMSREAYDHAMGMIESEKKAKKMLNFIPFSLFKKMMKSAVMKKKTGGFTAEEKELMEGLCDAMLRLLTKEYEMHMCDFLIDTQNHFGMVRDDFAFVENKVLLILSEDDDTFNQPCKDSLIEIMTNPTVITNITGGHLALLVRLEKYAAAVRNYILRTEQETG